MEKKEKGVIYPPDSPDLLHWETEDYFIYGKKYGLYNIITDEEYIESNESDDIMQYSIYLLEQIGLNFWNYTYDITFYPFCDSFSDVRSLDLSHDLTLHSGKKLTYPAQEYLMRHSNEYVRESIGKLMVELANARYVKCSMTEYLRSMANLHFQMVHNGHSPAQALDIVEHNTINVRKNVNGEALDAVKRFTHK